MNIHGADAAGLKGLVGGDGEIVDDEQRLAALRMFIAKSAYLDLYQGKTSPDRTQNRLI